MNNKNGGKTRERKIAADVFAIKRAGGRSYYGQARRGLRRCCRAAAVRVLLWQGVGFLRKSEWKICVLYDDYRLDPTRCVEGALKKKYVRTYIYITRT